MDQFIPFNRPYFTGTEFDNIKKAHTNRHLSGDGEFTAKCHNLLSTYSSGNAVLLTHSCTAALEIAALLLRIKPGDEIIMPSYTFVSTANAFVLRGGVPVFVDIRPDTLNLDENKIEAAITKYTKAIVPVHYAGVSCAMDYIMSLASHYNLYVVEDAAQAFMSKYKDKPLGSIGHFGTYSFHETKNVICGEGGALVINEESFKARAEILREKGTDRSGFVRGEVDKYTWRDIGSSYLPGELISSFLFSQLTSADQITNERLKIWQRYSLMLKPLEDKGYIRLPVIPSDCSHNGHMFFILLEQFLDRRRLLSDMKALGVNAVFHYIPLHSSPAGLQFGRTCGELFNTDRASNLLVRLPLWYGLTSSQQEYVSWALSKSISNQL